jgi:parallel beta-helix repeat protein
MNNVAYAISILTAFLLVSPCAVLAATITVPDDYSSIQEAVDAASANDKIIIRDGTYTENVVITKRLTIQSENGAGSTTVTAADPDDHTIIVSADDVTLTGLTVTGATWPESSGLDRVDTDMGRAGIYVEANHSSISDNVVTDNYFGIHFFESSRGTIQGNTVHSNSHEGIFLINSSTYNTIDNNLCYSNGAHGGIFVWRSCKGNTITNNICHSNPQHGIKIHHYSGDSLIENNLCYKNGYAGIYVGFSDNNVIRNNICIDDNTDGIYMVGSRHNLVVNNTLNYNTNTGIATQTSYYNTFEDNRCSHGDSEGIAIRMSSNSNTITKNNCSYNGRTAIYVDHSNDNAITYNTLSWNALGGVSIQAGRLNEGDFEYQWSVFKEYNGPWRRDNYFVKAMGEELEGEDCSGNKINYNNIEGNDFGVESKIPADIDARYNYWGEPADRQHPESPEGMGLQVQGKGSILYTPMATSLITPGSEVETAPGAEMPLSDGEGLNPIIFVPIVVVIVLIWWILRRRKKK